MALTAPPVHPHPEPGVLHNAYETLRARGIPVTRIVQVETDAILYLGSNGRPMTAWLAFAGGKLNVVYEGGFPAEPSPWAVARLYPEE